MSRIESIRKIVESQPNDPFARYGLAMELKNSGQLEEADATFAELARRNPEYVPQYLMYGNLLAGMERFAEARAVYESGLAAAGKKGDGHAAGELQQALDRLGQGDE